MTAEPEAKIWIGESALDALTIVAEPKGAPAAAQVRSIWVDGLVPADAPILAAWRRDASTRFPARLRSGDATWSCDVVITGVEWGRRPGVVRLQAQSVGLPREMAA